MKKLLVAFLLLSNVSFSQTFEEYFKSGNEKARLTFVNYYKC